ncbi:MAG: hypothetical protein ACR652_25710 [Methylocystis sp.]|uniref:hypothetical protein n=1 Tax=Methylocystis sp. TaxID=1911079 RepID=UPI003DA6AE81
MTNTSSGDELIANAELKEIMLRVERKLDPLLSFAQTRPSIEPRSFEELLSGESKPHTSEEDDGWMEGLDGMTLFNLERGYVTKEEVRKALREG